tara:strand:+ start:327 stop:587 length:261 start_codon:yes stop_codon:yes gene_type:complete
MNYHNLLELSHIADHRARSRPDDVAAQYKAYALTLTLIGCIEQLDDTDVVHEGMLYNCQENLEERWQALLEVDPELSTVAKARQQD